MQKETVITGDYIDEERANEYFATSYKGIDLLPQVPETLSEEVAAGVLNVSEPTIKRMVQDGQIKLKKDAILSYIHAKMLVNRPLNLD